MAKFISATIGLSYLDSPMSLYLSAKARNLVLSVRVRVCLWVRIRVRDRDRVRDRNRVEDGTRNVQQLDRTSDRW